MFVLPFRCLVLQTAAPSPALALLVLPLLVLPLLVLPFRCLVLQTAAPLPALGPRSKDEPWFDLTCGPHRAATRPVTNTFAGIGRRL